MAKKETPKETARKKLLRHVRRLVREYPNEVLEALLQRPFWPDGLDTKEVYRRYSDDNDSFLRILFSEDGDVWTTVFSHEDPEEPGFGQRYRTGLGGGESLLTRNGLLILAKAIQMDNAKKPQRR